VPPVEQVLPKLHSFSEGSDVQSLVCPFVFFSLGHDIVCPSTIYYSCGLSYVLLYSIHAKVSIYVVIRINLLICSEFRIVMSVTISA
jgi:hypothetical protein